MSVGVSFVIPTYRSTDTLSRSLGSLIAQSDRDWEATIVDDGSDDATVDMVRAWCARDHGLSQAKAGLPYFHRRMPSGKVDKTSFDLCNLSLGGFKLDCGWRGLDICTRMCAGTSLTFCHG